MTPRLRASYRRWRGYSSPPGGIDLLLTDACNLRCSYCPIWGDDAVLSAASMMETAPTLRLIDEVSAFRPMIRLFGGEPFLHLALTPPPPIRLGRCARASALTAEAGSSQDARHGKLGASIEMLRGALSDPSFSRQEDASFCRDKLPKIGRQPPHPEIGDCGRAFNL